MPRFMFVTIQQVLVTWVFGCSKVRHIHKEETERHRETTEKARERERDDREREREERGDKRDRSESDVAGLETLNTKGLWASQK